MIKLTKEIKDEILVKYLSNEYNCLQLDRLYNLCPGSTLSFLRRKGIDTSRGTNKRYSYDREYFKEINTPEKAYILGFFYTDGCNTNKNSMKLSLHSRDKHILDQIKELFKSNRPIRCVEKTNDCTFEFHDKLLCEYFTKYGCPPRKTFKMTWPEWLPEELWPHFIRGMWDGDGHIGEKEVSFMGTENICKKIIEIVFKKFNAGYNISVRCEKFGVKLLRLRITGGMDKFKAFLNWIYKDSTIHLHRKYEKYLYIKNWQKKPPRPSKLSNEERRKKKIAYEKWRKNKINKTIILIAYFLFLNEIFTQNGKLTPRNEKIIDLEAESI